MKILVVHNLYQSKLIGGEDLVFQNEVKALIDVLGKDKVFVYTVKNDDIGTDFASQIGVLFEMFTPNQHTKTIFNLVHQNQIDIVHVHNTFPRLSPSIFKAAKLAGAKVVYTLHNFRHYCMVGTFYCDKSKQFCLSCAPAGGWFSKLFSSFNFLKKGCRFRGSLLQSIIAAFALKYYQLKNDYQYIDAFFYLSESSKQLLIKAGIDDKRMVFKPNFIKPSHQPVLPFSQREGFLFVGRLEFSKGIHCFLEAWDTLSIEIPLLLIGDGPDAHKLKKQYAHLIEKGYVRFLGQLPQNEVFEYMRKSYFLIQSALWNETFALTQFESMTFGTPVLGFKIGTREDYIQSGVNGFTCYVDDIILMMQKAIEVTKDEKDFLSLSNGALGFVREFSQQTVIQKQIHIYEQL